MTELKKAQPDEVQCQKMEDGGALVHARIGFCTVFRKAFSDEVQARTVAAELFSKEFEYDPDADNF